jgi:hypothetical protein
MKVVEEGSSSCLEVESERVIDDRSQSSGVATRVVAATFHGFCRHHTSDVYKY